MASRATQTDTGINPQIAELLGLDFTADLDREDYISLLKEKMMAGRMSSSKLSSEETEILTDEFKRIKKDTRKTFKVKKTKISADSFKKQSPTASATQKALPGTDRGGALAIKKTKVDPGALVKSGGEEKEQSILEKILAGVTSILGTLKEDQNQKKKISNTERRQSEKKKRKGKEDKLEGGIFKGLAKSAKKILKPVEGILSRILKFIGTILIGKILMKIVTWMSDPKNKGKLKAIGDFLSNTWPLLLAAYLLFGNSLGRFATKLIGTVIRFSGKLLKKLIPGLLKGIKRLGFKKSLAVGALAVGGGMLAGRIFGGGEEDKQPAPGKDGADGKDGKDGPETKQMVADGKDGKDAPPKEMSKGGTVAGSGNKDTVPAMLTPGEYVMSKGAVQKYGKGTMESMNAMGGGSGIPSFNGGLMYAKNGGNVPGSDEDKQRPQKSFLEMMGFGSSSEKKDDKEKGREGKSEEKSSSSTLSETQQKALQVLAKYESGAAGYDAVNQIGTKGGRGVEGFSGDIKKMPQHEGRSLTDFTVREIKSLQYDDKTKTNSEWIKSGKLHAVGAYQFIGNTLPGVAARAGIPDTAKFSPAVQDLMALQLIKERGISPWVGPSDKATASERAIVEQARSEPIAYDKTSGGGAITAFSGNSAGSYTPPGQSGSGSSPDMKKKGGGDGGGFGGLVALSKLATIGPSSSSSSSTPSATIGRSSSSSSSTPSATMGSKATPKAPPAPPTKQTPKVSVLDGNQSSGGNQEVPKSDSGANVNATIPSPPKDLTKCLVLGIPA